MYDEWFEVLFEIKYAHQIINVIKSFIYCRCIYNLWFNKVIINFFYYKKIGNNRKPKILKKIF